MIVDQTHISAFSSPSIFFVMVLVLLDLSRSGIKPKALHSDTPRWHESGQWHKARMRSRESAV